MPTEPGPHTAQVRRPPQALKLLNRLVRPLLTRGHGPTPQRLLVLTGLPRTTPVAILTQGASRYVVAGYAAADWVGNARANPYGTLRRGTEREPVQLIEVPIDARPPVLRAFLRDIPGGRRFLTVSKSATDEELLAAASEHPVFQVTARPPNDA